MPICAGYGVRTDANWHVTERVRGVDSMRDQRYWLVLALVQTLAPRLNDTMDHWAKGVVVAGLCIVV